MRIVFYNSVFPQPSQTFVLDQIRHARAAGHEVAVYCKRFNRALAVKEAPDLLPVVVHDRPRDAAMLAAVARGLASNPPRLSAYLSQRRSLGLHLSDLVCAAQARAAPDVIVANFGQNGIAAARLKLGFFPDARLVVVFHGYDVSAWVAANGWEAYRRAAPAIDLAIAVNRNWAKLLRENTAIAQIAVHHLGVDLGRIPAWRGHDGGPFTILYVGRMVEKKGFPVLVEALRTLRERNLDVAIQAVGDGPDLAGNQALVARLGLADRVVFHGSRPHDFALRLMSESDCLVLPSLTASDGDQEGIPVTLMEAMACGLPVVSTVHSGIPELVEDGVTGLLVPERDAAALAGAIATLMRAPALRRQFAENARRFVESGFNAARQNPALLDLIVGRGGGR